MKKTILLLVAAIGLGSVANAQTSFGHIQNQIPRDQRGINQFDIKKDSAEFKGLSIDLGAAFNMNYQAINSFNDQPSTFALPSKIVGYQLMNNENNFTLPSADMTIGAQLFEGVRVNLDIYLASRHHNETYARGGYLQIDKLDFIKKDFLADIMKYATIKIGQMENNFGDAHFRASDNGSTMRNAFVGNNIMNAFITDLGMEVYYNRSGLVSMIGVTNGNLNQGIKEVVYPTVSPATPNPNTVVSPTILAKLGYDKQIDQDLRVRLTGSYYHSANLGNSNLYSSNRSGFGFWGVLNNNAYTNNGVAVAGNYNSTSTPEATFNPGFKNWATSLMFNPFVKYKGFEFFGTVELTSGGDKVGVDDKRTANQYAGDVVYRFGKNEQFYIAGKYNTVSGKLSNADAKEVTVNRVESSLGWFMTKNILAKLDYVSQNYKNYTQFAGNVPTGNANNFYGGNFKGLVFEATISF
ncbi:hypothetical protein [Flavobacterium sp.]|uniref:hypothetical protein n=1 Tax=Flavobacterium sp. TaxID=239 RepID=UPI00286DFA34|nr:hypothetical protein [Flavobacterium sp.]